jgi:chromosome segregation ATPase
MPKRSEAGTAILEPLARTPEEILAAVAEKSESIRRESLVADWRKWREITEVVADGRTLGGQQLEEIAQLAARLRQPDGALAATVTAITRDRALEADIAAKEKELDAITQRGPALLKEVEAAKARLDELAAEQRRAAYAPTQLASLLRSREELRRSSKEAFSPLEELAERSIKEGGRP